MKNIKQIFLLVVAVSFAFLLNAQNDCKVLVPELNGTYLGKCKKGLAHGFGKAVGKDTYEGTFKKGLPNGQGLYTWASGATYDGEWVYGQRDGLGVYTFNYHGRDSIQKGKWDGDIFIGKVYTKPLVMYKEFVTRYSFRREGDGDRILIDLRLNGQQNKDILDFSLISSSGSQFEMGRSYGLEMVDFPVTIKVKYVSWNASHSSRHDASFEFEIYEPGNWQVDITN